MTNKPTELVPTQALLPCPFCGNDGAGPIEDALQIAFCEHEWRTPSWSVQCDKCTANMGYSDSEAEAIAAWNTRLASTAPASEEAPLITSVIVGQSNKQDVQGRGASEVELDRLAELLANFARDRFANTKELTWATMGEHSQQYFRDAVNVVRAALRPRSEWEDAFRAGCLAFEQKSHWASVDDLWEQYNES